MTYKDNIERRAAELEVRAKGRRLEGYAATFNTRTKIADFEEEIRSGAFAASLLSGDKLALVDHDPNKLLGRTKSGTLKLAEDQRGLAKSNTPKKMINAIPVPATKAIRIVSFTRFQRSAP